MKTVKLYKDDIKFLNELLDCYSDIILHFPFSHYREYKFVYNKIKFLKEKLGSV